MEHKNLVKPLHDSFDAWYKIAVSAFGLTNWARPTLNIVSLTGTTAGRAMLKSNVVQINWALYVRNQEGFFNRTVPHELSHLVDYQTNNRTSRRDGHGIHWKTIMRRMGVADITPCHSYDTSCLKQKSISSILFEYRCSNLHQCAHTGQLDSKTHYRVQYGHGSQVMFYSCKRCGSKMIHEGKMVSIYK